MKKRGVLFLLLFLTLFVSKSFGQELEPVDLVKKIFSKDPFPDLNKFISGEYTGEPNGKDLNDDLTLRFRLLEQSADEAVVNMTMSDSIGKGLDLYLYLKKDTVWKVTTLRSLAMTGIIEMAIAEMEKMSEQEITNAVKMEQKTSNSDNIMYRTKEEFADFLENFKLTIALDDDIIQHFETHKAKFEDLKHKAIKELSTKEIDDREGIKLLKEEEAGYKKLLISTISFGDYLVGEKCLIFSIGGMIDNTVGYLYVQNVTDLPKMHPSRIIMLREIGNGWYLYKTT